MRVAARATSPASSSGYCRPWARLSAWSGKARCTSCSLEPDLWLETCGRRQVCILVSAHHRNVVRRAVGGTAAALIQAFSTPITCCCLLLAGPAWISRPQQAKARLAWCASSSWRVQTFAASAGVQQPQQHAEEEQQRPDEQDQGEAGSSSSSAAPGPPAPAAVNSGGSASGAMQWREVWPLLRPDWPMLAACAACALVSVVSNCLVAPSMGRGELLRYLLHSLACQGCNCWFLQLFLGPPILLLLPRPSALLKGDSTPSAVL